jgi:hypothetical protein
VEARPFKIWVESNVRKKKNDSTSPF